MDRMGLEEGEVIQHSMISSSIERAQKKVEENNFGIRKRLLEYDDVMNFQREAVYKRRRNALYGERLELDVWNLVYDVAEEIVGAFKPTQQPLGAEAGRHPLLRLRHAPRPPPIWPRKPAPAAHAAALRGSPAPTTSTAPEAGGRHRAARILQRPARRATATKSANDLQFIVHRRPSSRCRPRPTLSARGPERRRGADPRGLEKSHRPRTSLTRPGLSICARWMTSNRWCRTRCTSRKTRC